MKKNERMTTIKMQKMVLGNKAVSKTLQKISVENFSSNRIKASDMTGSENFLQIRITWAISASVRPRHQQCLRQTCCTDASTPAVKLRTRSDRVRSSKAKDK